MKKNVEQILSSSIKNDTLFSPFIEIDNLLSAHLKKLDEELEKSIHIHPGIQSYVQYALSSGGKRLRPLLALLVAGATGEISSEQIVFAAIVELIHIASMVHDDIIDHAEYRRNKLTLCTQWDQTLSVLVGDILFVRALKMSMDIEDTSISKLISNAVSDVCIGEILQNYPYNDDRKNTESLDHYYHVIQLKTGTLFSLSAEIPAKINKAPTASGRCGFHTCMRCA